LYIFSKDKDSEIMTVGPKQSRVLYDLSCCVGMVQVGQYKAFERVFPFLLNSFG